MALAKISWKIVFIMSKSMAASFSLWITLMGFDFLLAGQFCQKYE
jgi:hypothetical protein